MKNFTISLAQTARFLLILMSYQAAEQNFLCSSNTIFVDVFNISVVSLIAS